MHAESDRQKIQILKLSDPENKVNMFYRRNKRDLNMSVNGTCHTTDTSVHNCEMSEQDVSKDDD